MKYLIEKYNHQDSLIVISSYPEKNIRYSQKVCAVGGFTKNVIDDFPGRKIIFTTRLGYKKDQIYQENNSLVYRIFKRNSLFSFIKLFLSIKNFTYVKKVLIQFEFSSFGDIFTTIFFPILLICLKLSGKKIYFVFHQVIFDLNSLTEYLGWEKNDWRLPYFNFFLKLFYQINVALSEKTIVLEEEFKQRLLKISDQPQKIAVIPHGVDTNLKIIDQTIARKKLKIENKPTILFFGYLTWYKGADFMIEIANINKKLNFIIAGGPSFTQKRKLHYQKYLKKFSDLPKNLKITGFVKERLIPLYFSAADQVILPYRSMISSSGPLSLAFSFEKPTILSKKLNSYVKSKDFKINLTKSGLIETELFRSFEINKKIILNNKLNLKLIKFSKLMKISRNYEKISKEYFNILQ
ncbi:MAG: glycosyltransferase [Patescibacteria group bacterium]|jgi:glycosyltransferase involved in cell wall biosynthesis